MRIVSYASLTEEQKKIVSMEMKIINRILNGYEVKEEKQAD